MNRALPGFYEAEERNKISHFTTQGFDLNGVIFGGANDGEEIHNFIRMGVDYIIGFEPVSQVYKKLAKDVHKWPNELNIHPKQLLVYPNGLHNTDEYRYLFLTAGDAKGSTLMDVNYDHPEVQKNWNDGQAMFVGKETIRVNRFDTWAKNQPIVDLKNYDTLQLDTQGNEFEILEGMGDLLAGFKYLCLELSTIPAYKGEVPAQDVAAWLDERGFMLDSPLYTHNDAFFIRKDIKSETDGLYKGRC